MTIKPQVTKRKPFAKSLVHTECPTCKSKVWTVWTDHETGKPFCEFCAPPGTVVKSLRELNEERRLEDERKKRRKK
jgi:hypothetical protein